MSSEVVCFHCGQPIGDPPRLHEVDGEPCPACAQRLLESVPGIFHAPYETVAEAVESREADEAEGSGEYRADDYEGA